MANDETGIKIVMLPGLPEKGDVLDYIEAGGTREAFLRHCAEAAWFVDGATPDPEEIGIRLDGGATDDDSLLEQVKAALPPTSGPNAKGWYEAHCPWTEHHTNGDGRPSFGYTEVGFKCQKPDCPGYKGGNLRALAEKLGVQTGDVQHGDAAGRDPHPSQASQLVAMGKEAKLFHTADGEAYATVDVVGHDETWPLRAKPFRRWLGRQFYEANGKTPGGQALTDALAMLEGSALFDGPELPVHVRVAEVGTNIYLDLADADRHVVEITTEGWHVLDSTHVKFRRGKAVTALPLPVRGGSVGDLRRFLNVSDEDDFRLIVAWLLKALRPSRPSPVLALHGQQGSAKSTTARVLRGMVDPSAVPLRSTPREPRDLMIAAQNALIVAYDNLSLLPDWLSDAICRLSTGGGFGTRELYTDADEVLFEAMRPVIINGIAELAARGDLLDRSILIYAPKIEENKRLPEETFWPDFEAIRPSILGALLDAASAALRDLPSTVLSGFSRMADFEKWATAAEAGLGWESGSFRRAYRQNRDTGHLVALEAAPITPYVVRLMDADNDSWRGTASALLQRLNGWADESLQRSQGWPKAPHSLSGALKRVAPDLAVVGITVVFDHHKQRLITISRSPRQSDGSDGSDGGKEGGKDVATKPAKRRRATASDGKATASYVQNVATVATVAKKRLSNKDKAVAFSEHLKAVIEGPLETLPPAYDDLGAMRARPDVNHCHHCGAEGSIRASAIDKFGTAYTCIICGREQPTRQT